MKGGRSYLAQTARQKELDSSFAIGHFSHEVAITVSENGAERIRDPGIPLLSQDAGNKQLVTGYRRVE